MVRVAQRHFAVFLHLVRAREFQLRNRALDVRQYTARQNARIAAEQSASRRARVVQARVVARLANGVGGISRSLEFAAKQTALLGAEPEREAIVLEMIGHVALTILLRDVRTHGSGLANVV